ncbi:3-oxosteroid 1-dehydrogenase [Nocardioides dokdonensis FR1436]|uniref:3-oxosteroid 1-dehydrogenase n=1 Tax=Nocardioides dokdonensis FR1436 TaxID=1300347 RepID=A0A1A9GFF5_9ACTN|nr:FAD-dependent oxidoreductase [Nocardioides dokdonensis]ANH37059.1 3-oxosteroid 1-dehydrogenase [Nocardioides dokdonensis FR1436]
MTVSRDDSWDEEHDVVVVGSGAGALTGAYLAARDGHDTVVLEKAGRLGGTSAYSGAACWLPGSEVQQRAGSADSSQSARDYLTAVLGGSEPEKVEAFVATAPGLVAELEKDPALEFRLQPFPDYFDAAGRVPMGRSIVPLEIEQADLGELLALVRPPVERDREGLGHAEGAQLVGGRALIGRLLLAFDRTGSGEVRTGHAVTELVTDGERVVGVVAQTLDGPRRIGARRGVLLGSGGFERNQEMRSAHGVPGAADWAMAPAGTNTGEPIEAAVAVGAATELMDQGWWCPGIAHPDGSAAFTLGFRGGVVVDATGNRFANESLPYDRMGREMFAEPGHVPAWFVFDARSGGDLPAISLPPRSPAEHLESGTWVQAPTLEELAGATGLPADALTATVQRFNGFAEQGRDEDFGRGDDEFDRFFAIGTGPNPALVPLDQPPYVAARLVLSDLGTKGGLRTDTSARVLREDGTVIAGLYAAGNASASMAGAFYPGPGIPIGTAMVFSALAVRDMLDASL